MRTPAEIVGLGNRRAGVSKAGKAYDFQSVSFVYSDGYTTGVAAATALINGPELDAVGGLSIGDVADMVYHTYNGKLIVDAIVSVDRKFK